MEGLIRAGQLTERKDDGKMGGRGGSSGVGGGGTPSGITYDRFMRMSDEQKYQTMEDIINNPDIQVPNYLDGSATSKVMYALGMNGKPEVVSDERLDSMPGTEIFRAVYETGSALQLSSSDILDQIRNGEYTQLSDTGGSVYGRALYFADSFSGTVDYAKEPGRINAQVMRAKIKPNAKIANVRDLTVAISRDGAFQSKELSYGPDAISLFAISHGYDGWSGHHNIAIINRKVLAASSQNRMITKRGNGSSVTYADSWGQAAESDKKKK